MISKQLRFSNWNIIPAIAFYTVFLLLPLALVLKESIWTSEGASLSAYRDVFDTSAYIDILWNTVRISAVVTLLCFLLSYPYALTLYMGRGRLRQVAYVIFTLPLVVNPLATLYAWTVLLQREGVINFLLVQVLEVMRVPGQFMYNAIGVTACMTYLLLPYGVLLTYLGLTAIDSKLVDQAKNLGSGSVKLFWKLLFPLSLPSSICGAFIVFALAMGYFVAPALLGGLDETMVSMIIAERMTQPTSWGVSSVLTIVLLLSMVMIYAFAFRLLMYSQLWRRHFSKGF